MIDPAITSMSDPAIIASQEQEYPVQEDIINSEDG